MSMLLDLSFACVHHTHMLCSVMNGLCVPLPWPHCRQTLLVLAACPEDEAGQIDYRSCIPDMAQVSFAAKHGAPPLQEAGLG